MELRRPYCKYPSGRRSSNWVLLVLSLSFSGVWWAAESSSDSNDVNALLALQQEWEPRAVSALQWTGNDPCGSTWRGIECDTSSPQRVTSIQLPGLGLAGDLSADISLLSALVTLDMSSNNLSGSIPNQIGQLTQLDSLYLQFNNFTGKIPTQIGNLKRLKRLYLTQNRLSGRIPNEIGQLANLYVLDVAQNLLEGVLPYSSDGSSIQAGLDNLTKAQHFHLNNNSFSGTIPVSMCHPGMSLIHLLLDSNLLVGTIPGELGLCVNLTILKLNDNQLTGPIPQQISQLTNLASLQLSGNYELVGPLPNLSNLTMLGVLELSNNSLGVEFPLWLTSLEGLTDLNMENASVSGQIPSSLFQLETLTEVILANNKIDGSLNLSMATSQLLLVSMENNKITNIVDYRTNNQVLVLRLQGNPVCKNGILSSAKACSDNSSLSAPGTYGTDTKCSNIICPSGYVVNPLELMCTCAVPYQGEFIFRAPLFTSLRNHSRIPALATELAKKLAVDVEQVELSGSFNPLNQLIVQISIFPNGSATHWSQDDVLRMSSVLGNYSVSPHEFGPPLFQQYFYDYYTVVTPLKGSGLSMVAKICIGVGTALLLLVILVVGFFACSQKRRADEAVELSKPFVWGKDSDSAPKLKGARFFYYAELKKATNNFSETNEIGSGGYGKVYRGIISSGEQVAIKRAQGNSMQGATEFKNEIELLSRVHHKNVVGLIGFCFEEGEQMLVYEYMAGGSLRDCLVGRGGVRLDWRRRIMIALGAARGITYLHDMVNPPIIHRDIKSSNILLDEKKMAKVADFGLSRLGPGEGSGEQQVSTQMKGTLGYLDPEYYYTMQLTEKSDVYSYGVVLLELLTARAPIEHEKYVVKEVKTAIDKGGLGAFRSMLDPRLCDEAQELAELNALVCISLSCVEDAATRRPTMGEVVKQLEELVGHDYPESGSSINIDVQQERLIPNPYGSESDDGLHTSRDSWDHPPAFRNVPASYIGPR